MYIDRLLAFLKLVCRSSMLSFAYSTSTTYAARLLRPSLPSSFATSFANVYRNPPAPVRARQLLEQLAANKV